MDYMEREAANNIFDQLQKRSVDQINVGDLVWFVDYNHEYTREAQMPPQPVINVDREKGIIYVEIYQNDYIVQLCSQDDIWIAPKDYEEKRDQYDSDEYWLSQGGKEKAINAKRKTKRAD